MNNELIHTPEGVRDIYRKEYADKLQIQNILHKQISLYGYQDIQTPTFEYFDVFGKEIGTTPGKDLFKFFDNEGNILCLRPDFTPSMARCAAKYFAEDSMPLRLCYLGNTFCNTSILQGKLKETTQMGAELMGDGSVQADGEMIAMLIDALVNTGLSDFQVSIGEIDFFCGICEDLQLSKEQETVIRDYIYNKNFLAAKEYLQSEKIEDDKIDIIMSIEDLFGSIDILSNARKLSLHPLCSKALNHIRQLYDILCCYGVEKYVSFDLSMLSSYRYYTGIIFKVYTFGVGDVIVKGGRYDKLLPYFGKNSPAIGFVIMIDDLLQALRRQKIAIESNKKRIVIVYDKNHFKEALALAGEYRRKGIQVPLLLWDENKEKEHYVQFRNSLEADQLICLTGEKNDLGEVQ